LEGNFAATITSIWAANIDF